MHEKRSNLHACGVLMAMMCSAPHAGTGLERGHPEVQTVDGQVDAKK